ncbi:MAG: hypothetical protein N2V75_03900 [Methanophagales archaeon]|nr:hypothetical protein [Methanophagales archaeon]
MGFKVEGNKIIIEFNPDSKRLSKSRKTYMLDSSGGFVWLENGIGISYNIVKKREDNGGI